MKGRTTRKSGVMALVLAGVLVASGLAVSPGWWWYWGDFNFPLIQATKQASVFSHLTKGNGSHAVAMMPYENSKIWTCIMSEWRHDPLTGDIDTVMKAYEYSNLYLNIWTQAPRFPLKVHEEYSPVNGHVAIGSAGKLMTFEEVTAPDPLQCPRTNSYVLALTSQYPVDPAIVNPAHGYTVETLSANASGAELFLPFVFYRDDGQHEELYYPKIGHDDDGSSWSREDPWEDPETIGYEWGRPSASVSSPSSAVGLAVFEQINGNYLRVVRTNDGGASWTIASGIMGEGDLKSPSMAQHGSNVVVVSSCEGYIDWIRSTDYGSSWCEQGNIPLCPLAATYDCANITAADCEGYPGFLVTARMKIGDQWSIRGAFGRLAVDGLHWLWQPGIYIMPVTSTVAEPLNPSIAAAVSPDGNTYTHACFVASYHWGGGQGRCLYSRPGYWAPASLIPITAEADGMNSGRWLVPDNEGGHRFASVFRPYYMAGEVVSGELVHGTAGMGLQPALAVDGAGSDWVAHHWNDTVWCDLGQGVRRMVFAGSSSAVPGQPSIVCYPEPATAGYAAGVVFAVYDTAGGSSMILFVRADTSGTVVDTIESVANLRDSLPSISVFKTDTLLCTFQHGDSVLSVMLADYGPGTTGRPGAWSSPNLVTADGYHPMSVLEDGSVLNCVWTGKDGDNYAIHRATNDLSGGMLSSGWTNQSDPSSSATAQTDNSVYAGVGVSVFQQRDANGKWIIKGYVRGEETTLVANDTDAYHPHAVAESSYVSPSVSRISVKLLWTEGVVFEVDSGVYDTGVTRYAVRDFDVSNAGSDATESNTGVKLVRKPSSDSLFCVFTDVDGAVWYARSAAGDSWKREA